MESTNTFWIPEQNLSGLTAKIAKLNKRAAKLGLAAIQVQPTGQVRDDKTELEGVFIRRLEVLVVGETPKIAGYTFIATLEHLEGEVIVRSTPSFKDSLAPYRQADPTNCDHCKTKRQRSDTFVVQHESGAMKQIGRNCLADFLGGQNPKQLAAMAEILFEAVALAEESEFGGEGGGRGPYIFSMPTFLACVASCIRQAGWVSRSKAGKDSGATADLAFAIMTARPGSQEAKALAALKPQEADFDTAQAALEWNRETYGNKPVEARSDFEHNMAVVTKSDTLGYRHAGLAAYAVAGYLKHLEALQLRKLEAESFENSRPVGEVGQRLDFQGSIVMVKTLEGGFGPTYLHKIKTPEGSLVVWFASRRPTDEQGNVLEAGEKLYSITGTPKSHETRNGVLQTNMSRLTFWTDSAVEAAKLKAEKKAARAKKKAAA